MRRTIHWRPSISSVWMTTLIVEVLNWETNFCDHVLGHGHGHARGSRIEVNVKRVRNFILPERLLLGTAVMP